MPTPNIYIHIYIYRKLYNSTLKWNNSNRKYKLFHYVIHKDEFLSKGMSNEEMANNFKILKKSKI